MCGICGIIYDDPSHPVDRHILEKMNSAMLRRGPDDEGYFFGSGCGLGIRRLSIIDVAGGHQPISSEDGEIYSVCNGEIYNHEVLRSNLEKGGHSFKSRSDSEVLPHLYEEHGVEMLEKLNGMFGLCLWDSKRRRLILARDRMGEKPLYWTHSKGIFLFASELKAILKHPDVNPNMSKESLSKYLAYEYVPAPNTIFEGIFKLEPGALLVFERGGVSIKQYWDIPLADHSLRISEEDAGRELMRLMKLSVERRLMSDVALGAFLSGGIDSSTIVALMSELIDPRDVKTYSIAFAEKSFDESRFAQSVASHFGTSHNERLCTSQELQNLLPDIAAFMDEPLGDASIVPTFALSKFTREGVTVALSGDGGDELFAGYPTFQAEEYLQYYRYIPNLLRRSLIDPLARLFPVSEENFSFGFKLKQFLKGAHASDQIRHPIWIGSFSPEEQSSLLTYEPPDNIFDDWARHSQFIQSGVRGNKLLYLYSKLYLAEDVLTKVDRASMAASLEVRSPFLDHELVEFVSRLPYEMKLCGLRPKHILKKAVAHLLPKGIMDRPKKGFGIPIAKWLKGPLKEMTLDLLDVSRIKSEGIFRPSEISQLVRDHMSGRADNRKKLWTLLMFEQWRERWGM